MRKYAAIQQGEKLTLLSESWETWSLRFQREDGSIVELVIEHGYDGPELAWKEAR